MRSLKFIPSALLVTIAFAASLVIADAAPSEASAARATPAVKSTMIVGGMDRSFVDTQYDGKPFVMTDDQWRRVLTADEYLVLRREGTERAFTGPLTDNKKKGKYYCAACHLVLFSSEHKYDSETGWPSFYQPLLKKNVTEKPETKPGDDRIEVECARCGSHLGHVFDDGPEPTGLRYCMNSIALKFVPAK